MNVSNGMKTYITGLLMTALMLTAQPVAAQTMYYTASTDIAVLEAYIAELQTLLIELRRLEALQTTPSPTVRGITYTQSNTDSEVAVYTHGTLEVTDDAATLKGKVDFNRSDEATVWFEYGSSRSSLNKQTIAVVLDEDDDNERFSARIGRLDDDETYYYRAVAEDEDGARDYGSITSFATRDDDRRSHGDEPEVDTDSARNITETSAQLRGDVDMNDFNNGIVFFAYGEDEDQVEDITDDYDAYRDIDEDGDDLQKVRVASDLDNTADYYYNVYGLDDDTDIYFTLCVEYEDEDDDETIVCGGVEDFETDS